MMPHRLAFCALGPYPGEVEVDFDELATEGLFLIHGPTGAGKTFLLDALCFALYGDVPGERRRDTLRSDHAPPEVSPWAELEFTSQGARWRVRRVPKHERAKKRGEGTTEIAASATLERRGDETWNAVAQKIDDVNIEVQRLLGLTAEQFQQVILLPQGRFERVLRSNSEDREQLLCTLFDTATFASASQWLDDEAKRRLGIASGLDGECAGLRDKAAERWLALSREERDSASLADEAEAAGVDESWPADQAALDDLVGQARSLAAGAASAATAADAALESARATITAVEQVAELWDRRESLCERRHKFAEALLAIDADREVLRLADAAEGLRQVLGDEQHRRECLAGCATEVSERLIAVRARCAAAPSLPDDLAIPPADDMALLDGLASIGTALTRHRDKLEAFIGDAHNAAARESDAAAERETEAGELRVRDEQSEAAAEHERNRQAAAAGLLAAESAVDRIAMLQAAAEQATERAEAAAELRSLRPRADAAGAGLALAERATLDRRREALDLRQRYLDGISAVLAGQLEETAPCPVCGSTDHPNPAKPARDAVRIEEVESAEAVVEAATEAEEGAQTAHQQIASQVAELRGRAGDAAADPDAAAGLATGISAKWQAARDLAGQVDDLQRTVATHRDAVSAATDTAQRAALAASGAAERAGAADSEAASLRARIEQAIGHTDPSAAVAGLEAVESAVEKLVGAAQARATAETALGTLTGTLAEQLASSPFGASDEARSALREAAERDELRRRVEHHDTTTRDIERDLEADDLRDVPDERPDTVAAADTADTADGTARDANAHGTRAADAYEAISGWAAEHGRRRGAYADALAAAELWSTIADRCNGRTPPKVSLQRWVLSAYLEEICVFANRRLVSMTGGRYRLSVHRDRESHNAKAGLGLRVHDTHTGSQREVSTLSGGETFQASLSLALGVADVVTAHTGGVHLDALFVDEGFGTLDSEALQLAMDELDRLREGGRTVGLISHVGELRERIRTGIEVRPTDSGSAISVGAVTPQ